MPVSEKFILKPLRQTNIHSAFLQLPEKNFLHKPPWVTCCNFQQPVDSLHCLIYSQHLFTRKDFKQILVSPLLQITLLWRALAHLSELFVLLSSEPHDCGETQLSSHSRSSSSLQLTGKICEIRHTEMAIKSRRLQDESLPGLICKVGLGNCTTLIWKLKHTKVIDIQSLPLFSQALHYKTQTPFAFSNRVPRLIKI